MAKYNIATSKYPSNFEAFLKCIREAIAAEGTGDKLLGYVVVEGPGCYNHGVMVEGPTIETFIRQLTMVLMPARYSLASDNDPGVSEGQFECCEKGD